MRSQSHNQVQHRQSAKWETGRGLRDWRRAEALPTQGGDEGPEAFVNGEQSTQHRQCPGTLHSLFSSSQRHYDRTHSTGEDSEAEHVTCSMPHELRSVCVWGEVLGFEPRPFISRFSLFHPLIIIS